MRQNRWLAILALPLVLCPQLAFAVETGAKQTTGQQVQAKKVLDVSMDETGGLLGAVLDTNGRPLANTVVKVTGREWRAEAKTNKDGHFYIRGLRGGNYQFQVANATEAYRIWANKTAPPSAKPGVLIVPGDQVQRGQRPFGEIFANPILITAIVAAAIAIPVAVHNSKSGS